MMDNQIYFLKPSFGCSGEGELEVYGFDVNRPLPYHFYNSRTVFKDVLCFFVTNAETTTSACRLVLQLRRIIDSHYPCLNCRLLKEIQDA